jgi:alkylation response protein AidB-like acyl-CoA dehydrogenase
MPPTERFAHHCHRSETALGDPRQPGPLSWAAALDRDEAERFPTDALAAMQGAGLSSWLVPSSLGGQQHDLMPLLALSRALSRRDPSVALAAGMGSWSLLVWMAGTLPQRQQMAGLLLEGQRPCLAASEPDHGADLLASEVRAVSTAEGWVLSGAKWPIGCADRARVALVLARTEPEPGPRSLSWLWVEPSRLPDGAVSVLPRQPTHGMRASSLAGLAFHDAQLPASALVGSRGEGLELTLKLFQLTRPLVSAFGLGIADTALRRATAFATRRRLYRRTAADLPAVDAQLLGAAADLLAAEALAWHTLRCAHTHPEALAAGSLVAKVMVPLGTGDALQAAVRVLGARAYLRGPDHGLVPKLVRDHAVLSLFDGSREVCLSALLPQLPALLDRPVPTTWHRGLPSFEPDRLQLIARSPDPALSAVAGLQQHPELGPLAGQVLDRHRGLVEALATARSSRGARRTLGLTEVATDYARVHTAASVLVLAASGLAGSLPAGTLARLCVARLLHPDRPLPLVVDPADADALRAWLLDAVADRRALSPFVVDLPDRTPPGATDDP